jgi:hypothetical protein
VHDVTFVAVHSIALLTLLTLSSENWFFVGFSVNSTPKCAQFDIPTLCNVFIVTSYPFGCRLKF